MSYSAWYWAAPDIVKRQFVACARDARKPARSADLAVAERDRRLPALLGRVRERAGDVPPGDAAAAAVFFRRTCTRPPLWPISGGRAKPGRCWRAPRHSSPSRIERRRHRPRGPVRKIGRSKQKAFASRPRGRMTVGMLEHIPFGWTEPNGMRRLQQRSPRIPGLMETASGSIKSEIAPATGDAQHRHASLMSIFFAAFCASAVFGRVTIKTPFFRLASILSVSMPSGSRKHLWNDPNSRSLR